MTERPVLFSAPMVRSLLADAKTQTRRSVAPSNIRLFDPDRGLTRPSPELLAVALEEAADFRRIGAATFVWTAKARDYQLGDRTRWQGHCLWEVGDTLWVREGLRRSEVGPWVYRADDEPVEMGAGDPRITEMVGWAHHKEGDVCVSIHMPRWASRITLRVTDVRVERLHEISEPDAEAEGVREPSLGEIVWSGMFGMARASCPPRTAYAVLWDEINGDRAWLANPWVWAVTFERTS